MLKGLAVEVAKVPWQHVTGKLVTFILSLEVSEGMNRSIDARACCMNVSRLENRSLVCLKFVYQVTDFVR